MKGLAIFCSLIFLTSLVPFAEKPLVDNNEEDVFCNTYPRTESGRKVPQYKKDHANEVFRKLKRALSLSESDPPFFELKKALPDEGYSSAMIDFKNSYIYLDQPSYDICATQFGKDSSDALACYLGHELAHFYLEHGIENHYASEFRVDIADVLFKKVKTKYTQDIRDTVSSIMHLALISGSERDADRFGGFLTYLAGYKTGHIGPDLLELTYRQFEIDRVPGNKSQYPTFKERVEILEETTKELEDLTLYFELANLFTATKKYEEAISFYKEVLKGFQSREVYNNLGYLYFNVAYKKSSAKEAKFKYPIQLDLKSRLSGRGDPDTLTEYLRLAIENFESAIQRDKDYPVAHLNKGCAHALLASHAKDKLIKEEQFAHAKAAVLGAQVLARKDSTTWLKTLSDAYILLGIIEANRNDSLKAVKHFNEAINIKIDTTSVDPYLANANLKILSNPNGAEDNPKDKIGAFGLSMNIVDEQILKNVVKNIDPTFQKKLEGNNPIVYAKKLGNSRIVIEDKKVGKKLKRTAFQIVDYDHTDQFEITNRGLRICSYKKGEQCAGRDSIESIFGKKADHEINLTHGNWLVYNNHNIIFQLDTEGKLKKWYRFYEVTFQLKE